MMFPSTCHYKNQVIMSTNSLAKAKEKQSTKPLNSSPTELGLAMGAKIFEQRRHERYHKVCGHFISSNIRYPSFVKKSFQGTSLSPQIRDNFSSNCVSEQEKKNLTKLREIFVHNRPKKKKLLHFLHRCHGFREMLKIQLLQES